MALYNTMQSRLYYKYDHRYLHVSTTIRGRHTRLGLIHIVGLRSGRCPTS